MKRSTGTVLACAVMLALSGCKSPAQRAAIAEARYDQYFAAGDFLRARVEIKNAIRDDEDQPDYWVKLARAELQLGNAQGVYASYSRVLELQRDNVEALEWMATLSVAAHDDAGAQKYLDTLMVLQPHDVRGRLAQGTMALRNDHPADAVKLADAILADAPGVPDAVILKASAMDKQGQTRDAVTLLEARLAQGTTAPLLAKTLELYEKLDDERGIRSTYARLFHLQPKNAQLQLQFAATLFSRGEPGEALRLVRQVQASHPRDTAIQLAVIRAYAAIAGRAVAMLELQRLAATGDRTMKVALANYLLQDNEPASARRLVEPLVRGEDVDANNVEAQLAYATALKDLGESEPARALFDKILKFDETNSRALLQRTQIELRARQLDQALADVRVLVRDNPDFEPGALLLGQVYAARGDQALARKAFQSAISQFPGSVPALDTFIAYLVAQHDLQGALDASSAFVTANPKSLGGWRARGETCMLAGDAVCTREAAQTLGALPGGAAAERALAATFERSKAAGRILPAGLSQAINKIVSGSMQLTDVLSALTAAHRIPEARAVAGLVARRQPNNLIARIAFADLSMLAGDEPVGRAVLREVLAKDPKQPRAYIDLAYSYHRSGDDGLAFATLQQGLAAMPNNIALLNGLAAMQVMAGQEAPAVASYRRILAMTPGNLLAVNNLASLLTDLARTPAERQEAVRIAAPLAGHDVAMFNDTRGWALFQAGDTAHAMPLLKRAVQQDPDAAVFTYHLGAATLATDHKAGARLIQDALARASRKDSWVAAARALLAQS